ncbi:hypothetical protein [Roseicyclus sp.]|uniref:hypothetical protein n=1 Tax=Roseicyclus sp. TaxID=1914329 RepID=UPI001BCD53D9|nr:hypothetical protein [Roseicyclus sp.]
MPHVILTAVENGEDMHHFARFLEFEIQNRAAFCDMAEVGGKGRIAHALMRDVSKAVDIAFDLVDPCGAFGMSTVDRLTKRKH